MGGAAKAAGNVLSTVSNTVTGTKKDAGLLGTGQFRAEEYDVEKSAFEEQEAAKKRREELARKEQEASQRQAVEAERTTIATDPQAQMRAYQASLAGQLAAQSEGRGPSLAESQLRRATDRNIQQAMAYAASQRGQNVGTGLRQTAQTIAQANQEAARQAAELRLQEQLAAQSALAGVTQQARGQDIGLATSQAELDSRAALANQEMALRQRALNDEMARFYQAGQIQSERQALEDRMAYEQLRANQAAQLASVNQQGYAAASKSRGELIGNIGGAIGSMLAPAGAAASDKNLKKDIKEDPDSLKEFLDSLKPYEYSYKDPEMFGSGRRISPMAQDLEKTPIGKQFVADTPEGKMVDYAKMSGTVLAAQAVLNDRLNEIEKKLGNKRK